MAAETRHKRQSRYALTYDGIMIVYLHFYHHLAILIHEITEIAPLLIAFYFDSCTPSPEMSESKYAVKNYFLFKPLKKDLNQRK